MHNEREAGGVHLKINVTAVLCSLTVNVYTCTFLSDFTVTQIEEN
jgi:hypothetical protein